MHGFIHTVFRAFIVEKFGRPTWVKVLDLCGMCEEDESTILQFKQYEDSVTVSAICAAVELLGVSLEKGLELFGAFFVQYVTRQGWTIMLRSMGNSLEEFICNLNEMHHFLERDFRSAVFPFFAVGKDAEGHLLLTYSSKRCFPSLVRSILRELAAELFQVDITIEEVGPGSVTTHEEIRSTIFKIHINGPHVSEIPKASYPFHAPSFSFHEFHQFMASLWKPSAQQPLWDLLSKGCCAQEVSGEVQAEEIRADMLHITLQDLRDQEVVSPSQRRFEASPTHGKAFFEDDMKHRESHRTVSTEFGSITSIDQIRSQYRVEKQLSLTTWIGNIELNQRLELAQRLYRVVPAEKAACAWCELASNKSHRSLWGPDKHDLSFYAWSESFIEQDLAEYVPCRFVSHCWYPPEDWDSVMAGRCLYSDVKAAELCMVAKDLASQYLGDATRWREARFWIDKCCIDQEEEDLKKVSILLIEEFIQLSDGMVVVFTWSYFSRLWCVYEWACFLVFHEPQDLVICADSFFREKTEALFLDAVRYFSVQACQCSDPVARRILEKKISEYYGGHSKFERFLQISAIAITARSLSARGARQKLSYCKWIKLALELGYEELGECLATADPAAWRKEVLREKAVFADQDLQAEIKTLSDKWFESSVVPLLRHERERAVNRQVQQQMAIHKINVRHTLPAKLAKSRGCSPSTFRMSGKVQSA